MTRDDIIRMAREAGFTDSSFFRWSAYTDDLERFAALVAATESRKVAQWMIQRSYATGHGDTTEDLLKELEWQVRESEREACARVCMYMHSLPDLANAWDCAAAIRARGET